YAITLPATQLGHTIHFGHGRPRFVASRTTILPGRPCASLPSVGRRTKKKRPHDGASSDGTGTSADQSPSSVVRHSAGTWRVSPLVVVHSQFTGASTAV